MKNLDFHAPAFLNKLLVNSGSKLRLSKGFWSHCGKVCNENAIKEAVNAISQHDTALHALKQHIMESLLVVPVGVKSLQYSSAWRKFGKWICRWIQMKIGKWFTSESILSISWGSKKVQCLASHLRDPGKSSVGFFRTLSIITGRLQAWLQVKTLHFSYTGTFLKFYRQVL